MKKYQVLVFEPKLTHSVWQDWGSDEPLSEPEVIERLRAGVEAGEYVGWRVLTIHQEVIGRDSVAVDRVGEPEPTDDGIGQAIYDLGKALPPESAHP